MPETTSSVQTPNEPTIVIKKADFDNMVYNITELTKERSLLMDSCASIQKSVYTLTAEVQDLKTKNEELLKQVQEVNPAEDAFIALCAKRGY
jgi:uncharacterized protein YlxW (UPF0749 family)